MNIRQLIRTANRQDHGQTHDQPVHQIVEVEMDPVERFSQEHLSSAESPEALASSALSGLARKLEAVQAIFLEYRKHKDGPVLEYLSGFACNGNTESCSFKPGEGFPGQVAIDRKPILLRDIPDDYLEVRTGLGSAKPRSLCVFPLEHNEKLIGVVELATFRNLDESHLEYIRKLVPVISEKYMSLKSPKKRA